MAQQSNDNKFVLRSVYSDIDFTTVDHRTITEVLWDQLPKWKDAVALECGLTGKQHTYSECYRLSRGFSTSLIKYGAKKQDVCSFLVPNSKELIIALLGAWDAGCIVNVINYNSPKDELVDRIVKTSSRNVIIHSTLLHLLEYFKESGWTFENVIVISGDGNSDFHSFEDMCAEKENSQDFLRGSDMDTMKCVAILGKTSGTTGISKTVAVTHGNYISALRQFTTEDIMDFPSFEDGRKQPVIIGMLPQFQTYGLFITTIFSLHQGAKIVVIPQYEPELFVKLIKIHKPTILHLISPMVKFLIEREDVTAEVFENCRSVFVAFRNFSITENLVVMFQAKAGRPIAFQEGYGCTEALVATIRNPSLRNRKMGTVGRIVPNVYIKVADLSTGNLVGPYKHGEILIKGPQISLGYYNNPEATGKLFDAQGFIHTGDVGYYDDEECFFIIDRVADMIKVGNQYVSPTGLEAVLRKHPDIVDITIVGVSNSSLGQVPRAHIILKSGAQVTEKQIQDYVKENVPEDYKQLTGGVIFTDNIPRGATGKTLRRLLNFLSSRFELILAQFFKSELCHSTYKSSKLVFCELKRIMLL